MKKNISEITLFANIIGKEQREVREARIVELCDRPCYFYFNPETGFLSFATASSIDCHIEVAGIGVVSGYEFLHKLGGDLYTDIDDALANNIKSCIFRHEWGDDLLELDWANISIRDLNLNHNCVSFENNYLHRYRGFFKLQPISYSWTGTCSQRNEIRWKFKIDIVNNKVKMYNGGYCENEDKLGTLYATREMCEKANKPTIITFDKKAGKTAKLVTFELTTRVVIDDDCDDDVAIEEAIKKFNNGETNGICYDTCVDVKDDKECPYTD